MEIKVSVLSSPSSHITVALHLFSYLFFYNQRFMNCKYKQLNRKEQKVMHKNVLITQKVVPKSVEFIRKSYLKVYLLFETMKRNHYDFCRSTDSYRHLRSTDPISNNQWHFS